MCPQIVAGTSSDLQNTVAELVKDLLEDHWPISAFSPLKSEIDFGLRHTWNDYGDIDINVTSDKGISVPDIIGWYRSKVIDPVLIHLFVRSNSQQIPLIMGNAQRKIEEIIKDNATALGQGINMLRWDGWEAVILDKNLRDVWYTSAHASAIYWKVKT